MAVIALFFMFTPLNKDVQLSLKCGWVIIFLVTLLAIINWVYAIVSVSFELFEKLKKRLSKNRKSNKDKKAKENRPNASAVVIET